VTPSAAPPTASTQYPPLQGPSRSSRHDAGPCVAPKNSRPRGWASSRGSVIAGRNAEVPHGREVWSAAIATTARPQRCILRHSHKSAVMTSFVQVQVVYSYIDDSFATASSWAATCTGRRGSWGLRLQAIPGDTRGASPESPMRPDRPGRTDVVCWHTNCVSTALLRATTRLSYSHMY
jgi:hypothetical protein